MSGSVSSSLSELDEEPIDTEAETERLEISPQKLPKVAEDHVVEPNSELPSEATSPAADVADVYVASSPRDALEEDGLAADASPSPTKMTPPPELAGKKRKRKSSMSSTNGVEPARKRSGSSRTEPPRRADLRKAASSRDPEAIEETNEEEEDGLTPEADNDVPEHVIAEDNGGQQILTTPAEGVDGKKSGSSEEARSQSVTPAPELDSRDEEADVDGDIEADVASVAGAEVEEDEGDAVAKSEDEQARKKAALDALVPIEKNFKILREKLYNEKLAELDAELESLTAALPTHTELLLMLRTIDRRRDEKIQHEQTLFHYKKQTLERKIVGTKAQIHSQCFQELRQLKEDFLGELNLESCRRRRELRKTEPRENHYVPRFNPRKAEQIMHQTSYNKEVSLLSGLALYRGFPAAPTINGASSDDIAGDLRAMMISEKQPVYAQITHPPREAEVALEQDFVQKTPWANPNHPAAQDAYNRERQASANRELGLPAQQSWSMGLQASPHIQNGLAQVSPSMGQTHLSVENSVKIPSSAALNRQHANDQEVTVELSTSRPPAYAAENDRLSSANLANSNAAIGQYPTEVESALSTHGNSSPEMIRNAAAGRGTGTLGSPGPPANSKDVNHVSEQGSDVRDRYPFGRERGFVNGNLPPRVSVEQIGSR